MKPLIFGLETYKDCFTDDNNDGERGSFFCLSLPSTSLRFRPEGFIFFLFRLEGARVVREQRRGLLNCRANIFGVVLR